MSSPTNASGTPKVVKPERNVGNEVCNNLGYAEDNFSFFLSVPTKLHFHFSAE